MKISVVMCTYNGANYIDQQLDSLRTQTVDLHEVIVCDDGSKDGTPDRVRAYINRYMLKHWRILENPVNKGYRRNFRDAVAMAAGDWIALCDQDDVWHADKLERLARVVQAHPEARLVAGSFDIINAEGKPIVHEEAAGQANHGLIHTPLATGEIYWFERNAKNTAMLLSGNMALGCTMMVHRDTIAEYVKYSRLELPHDWDAALWAYFREGLYFLNEPVIDYRLHGRNTIGLPIGGETGKQRKPSFAGRMEVMERYDIALRNVTHIVDQIKCPEIDGRYAAYGALRRRMLERRSTLDWLRLHRYYQIYADMFTLRQRLGDLWVTLSRG